jgi:hypothetical protein
MGDLAWLPPFFSFSPAVTCKTKGTQQAHMFSVFFPFRFVSLQIIFLFHLLLLCFRWLATKRREGRERGKQIGE